ncbi:hypothetical protein H5410_059672 [Solanum commersonii]|uniref:Uncharacterized protein n=1 Tax=Solanum commersonii TaxID=4109 RepID=A0A9J5W356_SOLCO|nr:hypothetical protein H5410_059672 [Solanum commersonii]
MIDHEKKNRSVFRNVSFQIEPSKDEANCYTIYNPQTVGTNSTKEPITDRLNRKYKEMLHGWVAEKRQRENGSGAFDMRKQCRSLVEVRKYVFRGLSKLEVDQEITEVKEVQQIVGGLVGDNHRASNGANGGSNEGGRGREDDSSRI